MRASRVLAVTATACAAMAFSAPLASANSGPINVQVNPFTVHQGGQLRITVDGCARGGSVTSNAFPRTRLSANRSGRSTATARIYDRATPGTYNLVVRCNDNNRDGNGQSGGNRDGNGQSGSTGSDSGRDGSNQGGNGQGGGNQGGNGRDGNDQGGNGQGGGNQGGNDQSGNGRGGNDPGANGQDGNGRRGNDPDGNSQVVATRQFNVVAGRAALSGLGGSVGPSSTETAVGAGLVATAAVGGTIFVARRRRTLGAF